MRKKIFVIGDIHGHYKETISALKESGYDEQNNDHLLVSLGDEFDRGEESKLIYEWLERLENKGKAIVLGGNHKNFLLDYLTGKSISPFNFIYNGVNKTIDDFLDRTDSFNSWCLIDKGITNPTYGDFAEFIREARGEINKNYPNLINWLENRPWFFETKNYIFTHAAIDTRVRNWRKPHCIKGSHYTDWEALSWDDGSFLGMPMNNVEGKTVVVGHFDTGQLRGMYALGDENDHSILDIDDINGHKIFLDGCTILTKKVNVLVIEDELLEKGVEE